MRSERQGNELKLGRAVVTLSVTPMLVASQAGRLGQMATTGPVRKPDPEAAENT
jgi:hypothetical protein